MTSKAGDDGRFLSVGDVAETLQVSEKTVRRWIDLGELVAHRFGRQLRIAPEDFEVFVKLRRRR